MVVHHLNPPVEPAGQGGGGDAGPGEAAGHGDIDHAVVVQQKVFPSADQAAWLHLGGGDGGPVPEELEKLVPGQIHPLVVGLSVDKERHCRQGNADALRLLGGDTAVAVGHNRSRHLNRSLRAADRRRSIFLCICKIIAPSARFVKSFPATLQGAPDMTSWTLLFSPLFPSLPSLFC